MGGTVSSCWLFGMRCPALKPAGGGCGQVSGSRWLLLGEQTLINIPWASDFSSNTASWTQHFHIGSPGQPLARVPRTCKSHSVARGKRKDQKNEKKTGKWNPRQITITKNPAEITHTKKQKQNKIKEENRQTKTKTDDKNNPNTNNEKKQKRKKKEISKKRMNNRTNKWKESRLK